MGKVGGVGAQVNPYLRLKLQFAIEARVEQLLASRGPFRDNGRAGAEGRVSSFCPLGHGLGDCGPHNVGSGGT